MGSTVFRSMDRRRWQWGHQSRGGKLRRWLAIALLTALFFPLFAHPAWAQATGGFAPQQWLQNALQWVDGLGAGGPVAFILLYIVATVAFLPGSILTLGAGVVFGVVQGALYVFIGAMFGATAAFLVGRYVARGWVARKVADNAKFRAIDEAIGREGRKIIFLLRLSPAFPFTLLNYALGLTKASLMDYVWGTTGILPGTVMYVYLGSLAGNLAMIGSGEAPSNFYITWAIRIIGFAATAAVTIYVTKIARQALREAVPDPIEETLPEAGGV